MTQMQQCIDKKEKYIKKNTKELITQLSKEQANKCQGLDCLIIFICKFKFFSSVLRMVDAD